MSTAQHVALECGSCQLIIVGTSLEDVYHVSAVVGEVGDTSAKVAVAGARAFGIAMSPSPVSSSSDVSP